MPSPYSNGTTAPENIEFSDIAVGSEPESPDFRPHVAGGPWTNPPDAYSPKVQHREDHEQSRKVPKKLLGYVGLVCAIVFSIGVGLGIVIGHFAITKALGKDEKSIHANLQTPKCECLTSPSIPDPTAQIPLSAACFKCPSSRNPVETVGDEVGRSVFTELTENEIQTVSNFLIQKNYVSPKLYLENDRLLNVILYPVNKTQALSYLDNNGPFPGRYALATVARSSRPVPDVVEYKVGPLSSNEITIQQLRKDGEISFNRRPYDTSEQEYLVTVATPHVRDMTRLLRESFDGAYLHNGIEMKFNLDPATNLTDRVSEMQLFFNMPLGTVLHLIPVTGYVHHPGTNHSNWIATEFYYLSQGPFSTGAELQSAYDNGLLRKIQLPSGFQRAHIHDYDLVQNRSMPEREYSNLPPPITHQPAGPRYTVKGSTIKYMGWQFEVTANPIRGPAAFDIRFQGKRIAYEISLQDITLMYSIQSNGGAPPVLTDTHFYLGNFHAPRLGLDCPKHASILKTTLLMFSRTAANRDAMCVFEATGQKPAWRHSQSGMVDNYLVVRAPMNLGNYDYSLEWQFYLDGTIQTVISASGYLYGAFFDPDDPLVDSDKSTTPFGFRVSDYVLGPIHDHTFVFKVDVDVLGTENSFRVSHWKTGNALDALRTQTNITKAPGFYHNKVRYLEHEILEIENGFEIDPLHPKIWTVVNEKERNRWGAVRGYRLVTHSSASETFTDHAMLNAWDHLKYNVAVTKRKEGEHFATNSLYDMTHPLQALKGVGRMMDMEPCRGSDLVLWVSEKFMHAPTAEDLPMTLQVHRGFTLKPFNYFDRTSTLDLKAHYNKVEDPYDYESCPTA